MGQITLLYAYCLSNRKFKRLGDPLDEIVTVFVYKYNITLRRHFDCVHLYCILLVHGKDQIRILIKLNQIRSKSNQVKINESVITEILY